MGRTLIGVGFLLVVVGLIFLAGERLGIRLGHLPGDINIQRKNGSFSFPIVTCILVSVVLTAISLLLNSK